MHLPPAGKDRKKKEWCDLIEVSVRLDGITISGHANYAPEGSDVVCAAITVLTQTLIQSLEDLSADKIEYEMSPGWVDIKCRNLSEEGCLLVDSFFIGICMVSYEFPECVRIV